MLNSLRIVFIFNIAKQWNHNIFLIVLRFQTYQLHSTSTYQHATSNFTNSTARKVFIFRVILVSIYPHLHWLTSNTDTFYALYLKRLCGHNSRVTLTLFFQNFSVVLGKVTVHNMVSFWWWINERKLQIVIRFLSSSYWFIKTFDCICQDLLAAKLNAYRLSLPTLKLIKNYLQNRKQRTRKESPYSDWESITSPVPQGSIPFVQYIFMWPISWKWKQLLWKLSWWYHPILC